MQTEDLKPERVFCFFREISAIPRASGNEKAVCDYIENFARGLNLWTRRDEKHNLIIRKNGSVGYENKPAVIIQGHLDMVCEKNAACEHDFKRDPLRLQTDGEFIWATGTTLGADNGVAVAYAMALLEGDYKHPPLEVVLTADEETGMRGAAVLDTSVLTGKRFINIDEETEGHFVASCAGGIRSTLHIPLKYENAPDGTSAAAVIEIKGLKGGHSGMEANKQRANANILMGRLLNAVSAGYKIQLYDFTGGLKDNAIPREARAFIYVNPADFENVRQCAKETERVFKDEYKNSDPDITVEVIAGTAGAPPLKSKSFKKIISVLTILPDGVFFYGNDENRTPETSSNAGAVYIKDRELVIHIAVRSSVETRKQWVRGRLSRLAAALGGYETAAGDYPAWEYSEKSGLRDIFTQTYLELYDKKPEISVTHAGLECGMFSQKIKGVDTIAIGPDIYGAHSPDERMSVASAGRVWEFLLRVLEKL